MAINQSTHGWLFAGSGLFLVLRVVSVLLRVARLVLPDSFSFIVHVYKQSQQCSAYNTCASFYSQTIFEDTQISTQLEVIISKYCSVVWHDVDQ